MARSEFDKLKEDLERLRREMMTLRSRLDHVHTLASESLQGANRVTEMTNQVLELLSSRLRALEDVDVGGSGGSSRPPLAAGARPRRRR
jgi:hypothetical protein